VSVLAGAIGCGCRSRVTPHDLWRVYHHDVVEQRIAARIGVSGRLDAMKINV